MTKTISSYKRTWLRCQYRYLLHYVPSKYEEVDDNQKKGRQIVYTFKDTGRLEELYKKKILDIIKWKVWDSPKDWTVCFIPASNEERHRERDTELYDYLKSNLECSVYLDTFAYLRTKLPIHNRGFATRNVPVGIDMDHFYFKNVILIDDVLTTGKTFEMIGNHVMKNGALSVYGIFLSKTFNPEYNKKRNTT